MKKLAIVAFALCLVASTASAGTVDISAFSGVSVTVSSPYYNNTTTVGSVVASDFQNLPPLTGAYTSFCVDLQHTINPPLDNTPAQLDWMSNWNGYGAFSPQTNAGRYAAYLYITYLPVIASNEQRAGLALAIWNVLYDNDFTVGGGTFSASGNTTATNAANVYLTGLSQNLVAAAQANAYWLRLYPVGGDPNAPPQDFITGVPDGGMTLMLLGGALVGIGALRRKFNA